MKTALGWRLRHRSRCFVRYALTRTILAATVQPQQLFFQRASFSGQKYDELYDETPSTGDDPICSGGKVGRKGRLRLKDREPKTDFAAMTSAEFETSERDNQGAAIRATQVGAGVNLCLAAGKGSVGYIIGSTGLMADGVNHLGDLLCDAVVWYTVIESRKGATADRPWGMGKLEPLGALTVGALLMATGLGIGYSAASAAYDMLTLQIAVGASVAPVAVSEVQHNLHGMALGISGFSIVGKEVLYRYTIAAGTRANSAVVVANAWQHRSDAIVSSAVFVGLVGSMLGVPLLDPLAGLLVSGVIVKQSFTTTIDALKDLSDMPAPKHETEQLIATCLRCVSQSAVYHHFFILPFTNIPPPKKNSV